RRAARLSRRRSRAILHGYHRRSRPDQTDFVADLEARFAGGSFGADAHAIGLDIVTSDRPLIADHLDFAIPIRLAVAHLLGGRERSDLLRSQAGPFGHATMAGGEFGREHVG